MIHDIDESLRALVREEALQGNGVEVAFDAPTREWVSKRNSPSVNLYLYDIREDLTRRETMWENVRDEQGQVIERRLPPRWYRFSYLVTAWTKRPEDEHRLLSAMLGCFVRHETVPGDYLKGTLAGVDRSVVLTVALPPSDDRSIADVWSAMGGELKPSLDVIVTAPLDVARSQTAQPAVLEEPILSLSRSEPAQKGKGRSRRRKADSASVDTGLDPAEMGVLAETRRAGSRKQPGRTIRLRGIARR
jgi:hypothetical protein